MKITLLGTGSPIPDPNRAGPSSLVASENTTVLVDAGRACVQRLVGAGVFPAFLNAVVLTHLHSDHICDLNDVITTHWVMSGPGAALPIYGPPGTARMVAATLEMLRDDVGYRLAHHDDLNDAPNVPVTEVLPGDTFQVGALSFLVGATDHRPVDPSVGFRISDGTHSVVMAGDGVPASTLDELLVGADAYVQTVVRDDLVQAIPNARLQDILDYHSSVTQAAETAARAGVAHLVLTHYVPAPFPGTEMEWASGAREHFSGNIVAGPDLTTLEL